MKGKEENREKEMKSMNERGGKEKSHTHSVCVTHTFAMKGKEYEEE